MHQSVNLFLDCIILAFLLRVKNQNLPGARETLLDGQSDQHRVLQ